MKLVDSMGRKFTARRVAPGIYLDNKGAGHVVVAELMQAFDLAVTPENHKLCCDMIRRVLAEQLPNTPIDWIEWDGTHETPH